PGRAYAADEDKTGVMGRRQVNGEFAFPDFVFSYHPQSNVMFSVLTMPDHRMRSASTNFLVSASLCGFSGGKPVLVSKARNASAPSARLILARIASTT